MTKPKAVHFTPAPAPAETGPYDDPHAEAAEEGRRDIAEGRWIPHEKMMAWLNSWGTENELPPPMCVGETPEEYRREMEDIKNNPAPMPDAVREWLDSMKADEEDDAAE